MPSSWAPQALEAQAVAARTYAITTSVQGNGFDLYDDTRSQMYGGVGAETAATNAAVAGDQRPDRHLRRRPGRHLLLLELGRLHGERPERLGGATPEPWLRGVPDPYDGAGRQPVPPLGLQDERRCGDAQARLAGQGQAARDHGHQARRLAADHRRRRSSAPAGARRVTRPELQQIFGLADHLRVVHDDLSSAPHGQARRQRLHHGAGSGAVALQSWARGAWQTVARDARSAGGRLPR